MCVFTPLFKRVVVKLAVGEDRIVGKVIFTFLPVIDIRCFIFLHCSKKSKKSKKGAKRGEARG